MDKQKEYAKILNQLAAAQDVLKAVLVIMAFIVIALLFVFSKANAQPPEFLKTENYQLGKRVYTMELYREVVEIPGSVIPYQPRIGRFINSGTIVWIAIADTSSHPEYYIKYSKGDTLVAVQHTSSEFSWKYYKSSDVYKTKNDLIGQLRRKLSVK